MKGCFALFYDIFCQNMLKVVEKKPKTFKMYQYNLSNVKSKIFFSINVSEFAILLQNSLNIRSKVLLALSLIELVVLKYFVTSWGCPNPSQKCVSGLLCESKNVISIPKTYQSTFISVIL